MRARADILIAALNTAEGSPVKSSTTRASSHRKPSRRRSALPKFTHVGRVSIEDPSTVSQSGGEVGILRGFHCCQQLCLRACQSSLVRRVRSEQFPRDVGFVSQRLCGLGVLLMRSLENFWHPPFENRIASSDVLSEHA